MRGMSQHGGDDLNAYPPLNSLTLQGHHPFDQVLPQVLVGLANRAAAVLSPVYQENCAVMGWTEPEPQVASFHGAHTRPEIVSTGPHAGYEKGSPDTSAGCPGPDSLMAMGR